MRNELIIYRWNEGGKHLKTVDYFDHAREEARMTEALADEFLPLSLILNMILNVLIVHVPNNAMEQHIFVPNELLVELKELS